MESGENDRLIDFSIVIPVYYNEVVLTITANALYDSVINRHPDLKAEIIFVDDGSGDGSLKELLTLQEKWPHLIRVIELTRNFGQVNAIYAGLNHVRGRVAIIMSADSQDPAELINQMLSAHLEEEYDIVIATRAGRDESLFRVWTSRIFYRLMRYLSFPEMPEGGFDYMLLSRRVIDTLLRNQEATPFLQGQILWTGYSTKFIDYHRRSRKYGTSRWTFGKKFTYLLDGVLGYSFLPIRLMSLIGGIIAIIGFMYAMVILLIRIFWGLPIEGWAPLMIVILIMGGLQMLMLGMIGEYLWRVLAEVRHREPFVIKTIHENIETDHT